MLGLEGEGKGIDFFFMCSCLTCGINYKFHDEKFSHQQQNHKRKKSYSVGGSFRTWTLVLLTPSPCSYVPRNMSITFPHLASQSRLTAILKTEYELLAVCILFCKLRYNFQTVNQGVVWWIVAGASLVWPISRSRCRALSVAWKVPGILSQAVTGPSHSIKWPCFRVPFKD